MIDVNNGIDDLTFRLATERDVTVACTCAIEEMSELTKVLTKKLRNSNKFKIEDLEEELSHVFLMCEVLKVKFDVLESKIIEYKMEVLDRCFEFDPQYQDMKYGSQK